MTTKQVSWNKGIKQWETKKHPSLGRHHTEETKIKMRRKRSLEGRENISKARTGTHLSEEHKKSISTTIRRLYVTGDIKAPWKGKTPWLGKKHTDESKLKISIAHKGRQHTDETKNKLSIAMSGKNNPMYGVHINEGDTNPNWNGGISFEPYCQKFNNQLKERIRERDNRTCQLCGVKENGRKLQVHHIHYDKPNCNPDLISLCVCCNSKVNFNRDHWEEYFINLLKSKNIIEISKRRE